MAFEASRPRALPHPDPAATPVFAPGHLDALWFQVTGTLCNLRCAHCFLSCAPDNEAFGLLSMEEVLKRLEESVPLGVREYYFTGGEPFMHPRIVDILSLALSYGPTTVLTNGTLLRERHVEPLAAAAAASPWSLEFRLSLDGFDADSNDPLRGAGSFERAMDEAGFDTAHIVGNSLGGWIAAELAVWAAHRLLPPLSRRWSRWVRGTAISSSTFPPELGAAAAITVARCSARSPARRMGWW